MKHNITGSVCKCTAPKAKCFQKENVCFRNKRRGTQLTCGNIFEWIIIRRNYWTMVSNRDEFLWVTQWKAGCRPSSLNEFHLVSVPKSGFDQAMVPLVILLPPQCWCQNQPLQIQMYFLAAPSGFFLPLPSSGNSAWLVFLMVMECLEMAGKLSSGL